MLKIGLTGSIAVGKTFVCSVFEELGCSVLDSDLTARQVVEPGTEGLDSIVENFGKGILRKNGTLDRKKLAAIVFADKSKMQLLNSIVHPLVFEKQEEWLTEQAIRRPDGIAVIDAALMIESGSHQRYDKIVVVWCNSDIQLKRLMLRDNLSSSEAQKRIDAQMSQKKKMSFADFLIDTSDGFESTRNQVNEIYRRLIKRVQN